MEKKKVLTTKQFVKKVCKEATDESVYQVIEQYKNQTFNYGLFENGTTWYDVTKEYFEKYLKKFGRTNIIL